MTPIDFACSAEKFSRNCKNDARNIYHNKSGWQMLESTLLADVCLQISNISCYGISYMVDNFILMLVSFWYNLDLLLACPVNSG